MAQPPHQIPQGLQAGQPQPQPPPQPNLVEVIGNRLCQKLEGIKRETREQGLRNTFETRAATLASTIRTFNGEGSKQFKAWLKDVERVGLQVEKDPERMRALVLQTLSGGAADFFVRFLKEDPNPTWNAMRAALSDRFSDYSDVQYSRQELSKLSQRKGECVRNFGERILNLAEDAFPAEDLGNSMIQGRLIEILLNGVRDDRVARKLIRDRPETFEEAMRMARFEQQTSRAYEMRKFRTEEPMEIDSMDSRNELRRVGDCLQELLHLTKSQQSSNSQNSRPEQPRQAPTTFRTPERKYEWTQDGRPICAKCQTPGHVQRKCRKFQYAKNY